MKKISFLFALLCASVLAFGQERDVNFALASNGSSAVATSGNAALAIDGNDGTRWESATTDDETWTLDMGQVRTFNTVRINWEGAFADQFTISYSTDSVAWTDFHVETALASAGWQTIYKEASVSGRYVKYHGTHRATQYGQSFWEFQVMLADAPRPNLALSTNIVTDNKIIAQSAFAPNGTDAFHAVDGNDGSVWQGCAAGGTSDDEAERTFDAWFIVDLRAFYSVDKISIHFEGACSQAYHIDFGVDTTNWALGYNYVGTAGINGRTDVITTELDNNSKVRYVRFWSTKAATQWGMKVFEFEVYGNDWVDSGDSEAPVMVSATLDSKTWSSAVLAVSATDNVAVTKFHVVDATNEIDVRLTPVDGKISLSGLTAETAYNFTVTAVDAANNESANSIVVAVTTDAHLLAPAAAAPAPTYPANQVKAVYSATYNADCGYGEWGSGTVYTQEEFGKKYVTTANGYFGLVFDGEGQRLNCSNMEQLHLDVWIDSDASIRVVPIWGGAEQGVFRNLTGGQWNSVNIPLSEYNNVTSWIDVYQIKIDEARSLTFWLDNVYFYTTVAPATDTIAPTNVTAELAEASFFSVRIKANATDESGTIKYIVANGADTIARSTGVSATDAFINVTGLEANTAYNLSVIATDESGNAAAPVAVAATTLAAPAPAPAPDFSNKSNVVAVFCDALENNPAIAIGSWGQSTVATKNALAANDSVYFCTNMNYLGWEFTPHLNVTGAEYVHVDFFAPHMTSIQLTPISPAHEGIYNVTLTQNEWTSVDVPLSAYDGKGIDWADIFQFKFMEATPAGKDLFIDNVYFFKRIGEEGFENVENEVKAVKMIENGQLIIIKNGVRYNAMGQEINKPF